MSLWLSDCDFAQGQPRGTEGKTSELSRPPAHTMANNRSMSAVVARDYCENSMTMSTDDLYAGQRANNPFTSSMNEDMLASSFAMSTDELRRTAIQRHNKRIEEIKEEYEDDFEEEVDAYDSKIDEKNNRSSQGKTYRK